MKSLRGNYDKITSTYRIDSETTVTVLVGEKFFPPTPCTLSCRLLKEVSDENLSRESLLKEKQKETAFLEQKSEQYQAMITSIKVSKGTCQAAVFECELTIVDIIFHAPALPIG